MTNLIADGFIDSLRTKCLVESVSNIDIIELDSLAIEIISGDM
jgi:hypothetical protein